MTTAPTATITVIDVWSRTSAKYRIRAVLMLIILSALFAGLCCFTFWLRTGAIAPWQSDDYFDIMRESFRPTGLTQITLSDFLSRPIPVQEVPVHAVIMGLLFASLCSIPILVSILYRLPFAVPFATMVFSLAAMPWLGITVLIGCMLASMGHARFTFRYASALIGLIPTAIYFVSASWEPGGEPSAMAENQALLYAPWVLAMLSSCIICALGLAIAKLINYRPGGMPPVLALLFAVPVFLFHAYVGRDELEFRILENEFGRGNTSAFSPIDIGALAHRAATARWTDTSSGSFDALFDEIYEKTKSGVLEAGEQRRLDAVTCCDTFIERFPNSQHIPDVLFLKARSLDLRINLAKLESQKVAEFRADLPSPASRRTWQTLSERFPVYPGSATAACRLATLAACDGDFPASLILLDEVTKRFENVPLDPMAGGSGDSVVGSALRRVSSSSSLQVDVLIQIQRAQTLREMIVNCLGDKPRKLSDIFTGTPGSGDEKVTPLQLFLRLDPAHPAYQYNLSHLARSFPQSVAAGYIELQLADLETSVARRIELFSRIVDRLESKPGSAEAHFRLADALHESNQLDRAKDLFLKITTAHSSSIWSKRAADRLKSMSALQNTKPKVN